MDNKTIVAIDASTLDSWEMCNRKYELQYIKRVHRAWKGKALDQGGLMHLILKHYYTLKKLDVREIKWEHDKNETGRTVSYCTKYSVTDNRSFDFSAAVSSSLLLAYIVDTDLHPAEVEEIINVCKGYYEKYQFENWVIHEVEKPFAVTLYDSPTLKIIGQGIADIIGSTSAMELFIGDHKKRSRREEENSFNNQRLMYTLALGINTFITNKLVFIKDLDRYTRQINTYDEETHREWLQEVVGKVKQILAYTKLGTFYRNSTSCDKFGGCIYRNLCNIAPSRRDLRMGTEWFEGDIWDVGKILERNVS